MFSLPRIILLSCSLLIVQASFAQQGLVFNRFTTKEGINTNKINCTWQDEKGFVWVGSENGMQRFDGRKFVNFSMFDSASRLPPTGVDEILDAGNNKLWVRQGTTIGQFDRSNFLWKKAAIQTKVPVKANTSYNLFTDSHGRCFLTIPTYGVLIYDSARNVFTDQNVPLKTPPRWPIRNIYEDSIRGHYWLVSDSGLAMYDGRSRELHYRDNNPKNVPLFNWQHLTQLRDFVIDKEGNYWISYWQFKPVEKGITILRYNPGKGIILFQQSFPPVVGTPYRDISQLIITKSGRLWAAGTNSLFTYNAETNSLDLHKNENPREYDVDARNIAHLHEDYESNLWISTDNGLYVTNPDERGVFNIEFRQLPGQEILVQTVLETESLENWVGTWGRGIIFFDKFFRKIDAKIPQTGNAAKDVFIKRVWDLHQHKSTGHIWVACHAGNLVVMHPETKKALHYLQPAVFYNETIRHIKEDAAGNLWFSTYGGKLVKLNKDAPISNESFEVYQTLNSSILRLYIDDKNRIWLGTAAEGLIMLDATGKKILQHFTSNENDGRSLASNKVTDVVQYNDSLFFANTGALSMVNIKTGKVINKTMHNGLPSAYVSQMSLDKEGVLWLITNNGLSRYDVSKDQFTLYNQRDGILYAHKAADAKFNMRNGEVWFGGENVLFGFHPDSLKSDEVPPRVTLTDFRLFNTFIFLDSLTQLDRIRLNPDEHTFTIYFSALSFSQQDRLTYYYKMEGADKDWIRADRSQMANFSLLPPGHYNFLVRCENMQGVQSPITTLRIYIAPPFYKTWWFVSFIMLLVGGIIYLLYRQRVNKLLALEKLRTKVARDLHDDMGSTLSTINILSSMAKTRLNSNPVQASEYISKISDNSQRMMEAMDDIVWSIKPDNDTIQKITGRMREFATSVLEAKDIDLDFKVDENVKDVKLDMEARRDFFLIFKEAINNIAKYARSGQVHVYVACHQQRLILSIKDDGVGFDVQAADSGNGLGNMQKRAENLKARLQVQSKPGEGTKITLNLPVS